MRKCVARRLCLLSVQGVKNPISLARTILENTEKPQLMRRLPPNLLVGEGAIQFARDHKIPVLQDEFLIAPPAQWRWDKWHKDLQVAHEKELERLQNSVSDGEDQTSKSGEHAKLAENKPGEKFSSENTHCTTYSPLTH